MTLAASLVAGCGDHAMPPAPVAQLSAVLPSPAQRSPAPYRLQIGDQLSVRLFFTPELDEDVTIRPDGRLTTTLAEAVPAAGRTPEELATTLRTLYNRELREPRLTIEVKTYSPTRIYVAGEVPAPGELTTDGPPLTLVQAIARAGGLRISGSATRIAVIRRGSGDQPRIIPVDYAAALDGSNPAADLRLEPFDIVYVPRTGISSLYVWVNQHIQQFVPVSWGFSYNVNPLVTSGGK